VIDEQELYGLGDPGRGPDLSCRPVEEVLARGTRLRRRRRTLRTAGAAAVVIGLATAGLAAADLRRPAGPPDVRAGPDRTETASVAPPPPPPECNPGSPWVIPDRSQFATPAEVPPAEVPDELRLLPEWTPSDGPVTVARGNSWTDPCPDTAPVPADPALLLASGDANGDGAADATIELSGPLPRPLPEGADSATPIEVRGGPGVRALPLRQTVLYAWTDPDGWSWELAGVNVDDATLQGVAEALVLDSEPGDGEAVASLDPAQVPAGFRVAWQTIGTPPVMDPVSRAWTVEIGGHNGAGQVENVGIQCYLEVRTTPDTIPLSASVKMTGPRTEVNGGVAVWGAYGAAGPGSALYWQPGPGLIATAGCVDWDQPGLATLDQATIVRMAESVVPVAADDPRLPDPAKDG